MPKTQAKFWHVSSESSSAEENEDSSDSLLHSSRSSKSSSSSASKASSFSGSEKKSEKAGPKPGASKWIALDESSSDEEQKRTIRTAKEKRWDALRQIIKTNKHQQKINDFAEVQAGFEELLREFQKARLIVEKEGCPSFFVKALADLEKYVNETFANKEALKKLSKSKSTTFNTLRSKVRKGLLEYRELIDQYLEDPSKFVHDEDIDEKEDEEEVSESDNDSEEVETLQKETRASTSGSAKKQGVKRDSSEDWDEEGSDAHSSLDRQEEEYDQDKARQVYWGKKTVDSQKPSGKQRQKDAKKPREKGLKVQGGMDRSAPGKSKVPSLIQAGEKIDDDLISKKLQEVTSLRGRKGSDRSEQLKQLHELLEASKAVGTRSQLEVLGHLISTYFDSNLSAFMAMAMSQWLDCYEQIHAALTILQRDPAGYFPFSLSDETEDTGPGTKQSEAIVAEQGNHHQSQRGGAVHPKPQHGLEPVKMNVARQNTACILTNFLERLDDELTKAFQLTDIHSEEYKVRLGHTIDLLVLLWRSYTFLKQEEPNCSRLLCLRILDKIYYTKDKIGNRIWDLVVKRLNESSSETQEVPVSEVVRKLVRECLDEKADRKIRAKATLYLAYNLSLHGSYYAARDLLLTFNIYEIAVQSNIVTQILYNRNLVQLGICAFCQGLIPEAYNYLSDVCAMGRYKELLAQGISNTPKGVGKNFEKEKIEKMRLLPYHMHIPADLIEVIHNVCAMLLEVPYMAANSFDYSKKPIARNFRRLLEIYDRQTFIGYPENSRETIMAATKALQKGNWKLCTDHIMSLKVLDTLPDSSQVKQILTDKIKQECLRTYLFTYSSLYNSFSVEQLSQMFSLPQSTTHAIVSKMMIQNSLSGSWDSSSKCILINNVNRTPLQVLALQMTEKITQTMDQMETLAAYKNPKFLLAQANSRDDRPRRYDDRGAPVAVGGGRYNRPTWGAGNTRKK